MAKHPGLSCKSVPEYRSRFINMLIYLQMYVCKNVKKDQNRSFANWQI